MKSTVFSEVWGKTTPRVFSVLRRKKTLIKKNTSQKHVLRCVENEHSVSINDHFINVCWRHSRIKTHVKKHTYQKLVLRSVEKTTPRVFSKTRFENTPSMYAILHVTLSQKHNFQKHSIVQLTA